MYSHAGETCTAVLYEIHRCELRIIVTIGRLLFLYALAFSNHFRLPLKAALCKVMVSPSMLFKPESLSWMVGATLPSYILHVCVYMLVSCMWKPVLMSVCTLCDTVQTPSLSLVTASETPQCTHQITYCIGKMFVGETFFERS